MPGKTDIYFISGTHKRGFQGRPVLRTGELHVEAIPGLTRLELIDARVKGQTRIGGAYIPSDLTADSVPDFDNWGPDDYWSCEAFVMWHDLMEKKYGREHANHYFLNAWETAFGIGSYHEWCTYGSAFRNYFASKGVDVDTFLSSVVVPGMEIPGNIADSANDVSDILNTVTKFAKAVAPFALVGLSVWAVDKYFYPIFPDKKKSEQ